MTTREEETSFPLICGKIISQFHIDKQPIISQGKIFLTLRHVLPQARDIAPT